MDLYEEFLQIKADFDDFKNFSNDLNLIEEVK